MPIYFQIFVSTVVISPGGTPGGFSFGSLGMLLDFDTPLASIGETPGIMYAMLRVSWVCLQVREKTTERSCSKAGVGKG